MTTMSKTFFQLQGASSSSVEADYLRLSVDSVHCLAQLVNHGLQLNERQCQDLSSKLVKTVETTQKLVLSSGPIKVLFGPALKNLYRVLEKAKLLVHQCCHSDWCRAAVFQIHNEGAFREVLLEVGLCYNVLNELSKHILRDWEWTLIQAEDLRQSSLFLPASESEVCEDQETLKRGLEHVAGTSDDRDSYLARYLLRKLECVSAARMEEDLSVPDALLWMNESEPQGTWKLQRVIGSGSGASCVCRYDWLGIPCARKEFHCKVADDIFRREAAILAQLNHPNIVKFFCCSNDPEMGECFIAMELMEMSLGSLIESQAKAGRSFPLLLVLDVMTQIARGVCYLHGLNIAHRDLKPLNVVLTRTRAAHLEDSFCVKLVDFGMSKTKVQVSKSNTISIPGVGTTKYRAPEVFPQAQRVAGGLKRKVNWFRADAYSFGITCAVLLSLESPFEGVPASELYEELLQGIRPELPSECPEALVALLKDCWATNPQSRPVFSEICSRLEHCKLLEFLRVSSEGLQGLVGSEYIGTEQSDEQSLVGTRVRYVQSQCASTVSCPSDAAEVVVGISQFDEEESSSSDDYNSKERPYLIFSELKPKKNVGLWSRTFSNLARLKNLREIQYLRLKFQQKCEEFDVKPTLFPYNELQVATQDFHPKLKLGTIDLKNVYQGVLPNGSVVAVKKSKLHRESEFWNEVLLFTGMKHKNILSVKGCCLHDQQWLVVYEYLENWNVSKILYDQGPCKQMMTWPMRLKICLGVAQGLHYLHALGITHGNLYIGTIFLNRNFGPKIGSFYYASSSPYTRSHISSNPLVPTRGNVAPKYLEDDESSDDVYQFEDDEFSDDVYQFGHLCLEIISWQHFWLIKPQDQTNLLNHVQQLHKEDKLLELIDSTLHLTDVEVLVVQRVIELCLMCLQKKAKRQPNMAYIVSILRGLKMRPLDDT